MKISRRQLCGAIQLKLSDKLSKIRQKKLKQSSIMLQRAQKQILVKSEKQERRDKQEGCMSN